MTLQKQRIIFRKMFLPYNAGELKEMKMLIERKMKQQTTRTREAQTVAGAIETVSLLLAHRESLGTAHV
jgi:hypothetical protein